MKSDMSFQQILEGKLKTKTHENENRQEFHGTFFEPNWTELKLKLGQKFNQTPSYFKTASKKSTPLNESDKIPLTQQSDPISVTKITLSLEEILALELLNRWGAELKEEDLTLKKLKSSFRKLALKYHPDRNQEVNEHKICEYTDTFICLKNAFDILSKAIESYDI